MRASAIIGRCVGLVALVLVGACEYGDSGDAVSSTSNATAKPKRAQDAGAFAELDSGILEDDSEPGDDASAPEPAPKPDTEWSGTLAETSWIGFGDETCKYRTRFENVQVKVKLTGAEKVISASVTATFVEETVSPCTETPTPRSAHSYTYAPTKVDATAFIAPAAKTNNPPAELIVDVATQSEAKGRATLRWHRTGVKAPWDWVTGAQQVPLTKI